MEVCCRVLREPFDVDESYDVRYADDIITGRYNQDRLTSVSSYEVENIYRNLMNAEEYLYEVLRSDDARKTIRSYLKSLKCLMCARLSAYESLQFSKCVQLLSEYGYAVDKVFIQNATVFDKTHEIPLSIISDFLVAYDRLHNNVNLEVYSFLAEYVKLRHSEYSIYLDNKKLVDTYFKELSIQCVNNKLEPYLNRIGVYSKDQIVVDSYAQLVRKERIPELNDVATVDDIYRWCIVVASSGVTMGRLAELYGKEAAGLWDEILSKATVLAGNRVVQLGNVNPKGFRNRYIAVEETLLMITDWKIRDAEKYALKLKEIICKQKGGWLC